MNVNCTPPRRALGRLRALALGLTLFVYTLLGPLRSQPPFVGYVQGAILLSLCAWWAWKVIRRQGLPHSPVTLPLIALVGSAALSAVFSVDPRLSLTGVLGTLTIVLFFFVICDLLLAGWAPGTFVDSILLLGGLVIGLGIWVTADWYRSWWQIRVPEYPPFLLPFRLYGPADHPIQLAALINLTLPFAIARLAQSRTLAKRVLYGCWLVAASIILFYTRSRAGWVATGVVVTVTVGGILFQRRPPRWHDLGGWARDVWRIWLTVAVYLALFAALFAFDALWSQSQYGQSGGSVRSLASRPLFWRVGRDSFLAHPLTGSGPLTYARVYASHVDSIRTWVSPHAHNLFLSALTEEGIVGLAALCWALGVVARTLAKGWRSVTASGHEPGNRGSILLCVSAALLGSLAHAQVDIPFWLPTNALLIAVLLAMGLQATSNLKPGSGAASRWRLSALALPLCLVYILGCQNGAHAALLRGIDLATEGAWPEAARALDQAVAADLSFSFYQAQRGYAYGVLADPLTNGGDPAALGAALESYETALRAETQYVPDLLNAAWLLEQAGLAEQADQLLAVAVEHGADWALPALLLADRYATQGRIAEAEALFVDAFGREVQAHDMAACRRSAGCHQATERTPAGGSVVTLAHDRAQALLAEGRPHEALAALQDVSVLSRHPLPWLDRADAHIMLGQHAQARYALRVASILSAGLPAYRAHSALSYAAVFLALGQTDNAVAVLEWVARPQVRNLPYNRDVYSRVGLPGELLPSLAMLQRTAEDLQVYRQLAQLYASEGRADEAAWAERQAATLAGLLVEAVDGGGGRPSPASP